MAGKPSSPRVAICRVCNGRVIEYTTTEWGPRDTKIPTKPSISIYCEDCGIKYAFLPRAQTP